MEASTSKTQTAHLIVNDSAQTLVATVRVPAFPDNPDVVKFGDEVFGNGSVGYGVDFLTYLRQSVYDATGQA